MSAHNVYLTLIVEVGVVGLILYLLWLKSIWNESSSQPSKSRGWRGGGGDEGFSSVDLKALLIALAVSLWGGEILYPYRPAFAFMGMFLFLCAVMNHQALRKGGARRQTRPRLAGRVSAARRAEALRERAGVPRA
jgi:O-antigen ligase